MADNTTSVAKGVAYGTFFAIPSALIVAVGVLNLTAGTLGRAIDRRDWRRPCAYYRRVRRRFLEAAAAQARTEPYPVEHCGLCDFRPLCESHWDAVDHLVRVAGIRRDQINRLAPAGIEKLGELAAAVPGMAVLGLPTATFEKLRDQAALQQARRETGRLLYHLLPPEAGRGLGLLPAPSAGDLFLDLEGDPFWQVDRKLEYLFGLLWKEGDEVEYRAFWAHDPDEERRSFEAGHRLHPRATRVGSSTPPLPLRQLRTLDLQEARCAVRTREEELDDLLRRDVPTVVIEKLGGHPALIALPCRVEKIALDLLPLFESFESFLARNAKLWRLAPLRYSRLISQTA